MMEAFSNDRRKHLQQFPDLYDQIKESI